MKEQTVIKAAGRWGVWMREEAIIGLLKDKGYLRARNTGKGATSAVYCVKEAKTGKNYACKVSFAQECLRTEAELLGKIGHPLFPKFKDYWQEGEICCLLMEYLSGYSLSDYLKRRRVMTQRETLRIALALADGLGWLHECAVPIIYRDLKASHIILQPDGSVRLLDVGAAYETGRSSRLAGTPGYAAPEQFLENGSVDHRSDIYALGKVMHYMLTGKDPCLPPRTAPPVRGYNRRLPRGLELAVQRCTADRKEERIPDMRELIRQLAYYHEISGGKFFRRKAQCFLLADNRDGIQYEKNIWRSSYKESGKL